MRRSVKSFLYIGYFLALVFIGDRFFGSLLKKYVVEKSQFRYTRLFNKAADCEVLLIGNSRGLPFYQPYIERVTGKSTFNMSYNGMPSNLGVVLLEDYLERNKNPEVVIIEATMPGRRKSLVLNFACYSTYSERLRGLIYSESKNVGIFNDIFHLTRYNNEVFQRCLYYLNKTDTTWLNDRVIPEKALMEEIGDFSIPEFDEDAARDFLEIIRICNERKIKYRFVINPYFPKFLDSLEKDNDLREKLSAYLNVPIYDYSTSIESHELFADYKHVNKRGSKELIKLLYTDGVFDPKK